VEAPDRPSKGGVAGRTTHKHRNFLTEIVLKVGSWSVRIVFLRMLKKLRDPTSRKPIFLVLANSEQ